MMRVRVQSRHLLDDNNGSLEKIWRLSADDECFQDWLKNPISGLGEVVAKTNYFYIWANWYKSNHGLRPVIDPEAFGAPIDWRIIYESDSSDSDVTVFKFEADSRSLFILSENLSEFTLFYLDFCDRMPVVAKSQLKTESAPEWLAGKIAAIREKRSPQATLSRLNGLAARLQQLKQRRN